MAEINIETLIGLLRDSIGIEAAEKFTNEAIKEAGFSRKTSYTVEEFEKICEYLKKKGGFVKIVANIASRGVHKDTYYVEIIAKERREKEDLARWSGILEQRVHERTRELRAIQAQLIQSAKMAAIGQLGAGVAHELNNPIAGILGYAQFMLGKVNKKDFSVEDFKICKKYLEYIERESERCKTIVGNLLTFSRESKAPFELLDLKRILEDTLSISGHQLSLQNIEVSTEFASNLGKISGNANQLQQVFINLIINAQQAMQSGGKLKIQTVKRGSNEIGIEFTDTGCGIDEENLDRIFEPFFTTKSDWRSTGLGLSISFQIVQEHKGRIEVKSKLGKGTTFTVILPVKK